METYIEKIRSFSSPEYSLDLDVPRNWTHAYIELMDLESIRGKFSPGHNPNWYDYLEGEILTFRHDFFFRSQENPIPDKKQEELARKFAPILVLAKQKKEIPSNLEKYYGRFQIQYTNTPLTKSGKLSNRYEEEKLPYMILPEPEEIPGYDASTDPIHLYYHVRYADTFVSGTQPESLPGYRDDLNYWYQKGDGKYVISYWLWFDRNYGPSRMGNYHQGDLESYSVLADGKGNPLRILITGHDHITLDTEWIHLNSFENHPILYIAHGNRSDGGNPLSAYGGYEVSLDAGNAFLNWVADPKDIFPDAKGNSKIIIPFDLNPEQLGSVLIGADPKSGEFVDLRSKVFRTIHALIKWEEPGWVNAASYQDPDGHHAVPPEISDFLVFRGHIGKHPISEIRLSQWKQFGVSPRNAPFKTNIEQHYTYEKPRIDRIHKGRIGDYGPKFYGNSQTPQFIQTPK